jgi:hypothetical protein
MAQFHVPDTKYCVLIVIRYGNKDIDPGITGDWNLSSTRFIKPPPPNPAGGPLRYGTIVVTPGDPPRDFQQKCKDFNDTMEREAKVCGFTMQWTGGLKSSDRYNELEEKLLEMKNNNRVRIVFVVLACDIYSTVKLIADKMGLATQCLRWNKVERPPRGYHLNILLKVNTKMGGTNHALASRLSASQQREKAGHVFQNPPGSLSWVFDKVKQ